MKLTQPLLKTISHQLCHGNPWWGLVVMNEYLEPTTPLHTALRAVFKRRVPSSSELAQRLCSGALYKELSLDEQVQIGSRVAHRPIHAPTPPRSYNPTLRHHDRRPAPRRERHGAPATDRNRAASPMSVSRVVKNDFLLRISIV
jgi:hypothetical protein